LQLKSRVVAVAVALLLPLLFAVCPAVGSDIHYLFH